MSNALAIGAVTATLRHLLSTGLNANGAEAVAVTTLPPDKANTATDARRVNLFLYHTPLNAAWRNQDLPRQVRPGETAPPPLALDLHYLITAYEPDGADASVVPHLLLGGAMSTLHDHPLLGAAEIAAALAGSDLENQIERLRITPHPLSLDELSKLWTIFQTEYRISAAYHIGVVLIESNRATRAPLPVLSRGPDDRGVAAQGDLIPPFPSLSTVALPPRQRTARLGTVLTLEGHHLGGGSVTVEASHPRLAQAVALSIQPGATDTRIEARLPTDADAAPAGFYQVRVNVQRDGETFTRSTNELPVPLAAEITPDTVNRAADEVTIVLRAAPTVLPTQRAVLLLGEHELRAPTLGTGGALSFVANTAVRPIAAGKYFIRLRVDGVDSELVKFVGDPPKPVFDPASAIDFPA